MSKVLIKWRREGVFERYRVHGCTGAAVEVGSTEHAQLIARELEGHAVPSDVNR